MPLSGTNIIWQLNLLYYLLRDLDRDYLQNVITVLLRMPGRDPIMHKFAIIQVFQSMSVFISTFTLF